MRYRFAHQREDAGDTVDLIAGHHPTEPYHCDVCGQSNDDGPNCMLCNRPRGTWLCECGRLNPGEAWVCQQCGRPREQ